MKKLKFAVEQVPSTLRQAEEGTSVGETRWKMRISEAPFFNWKKYGGMEAFDVQRLRDVEAEHAKLKRLLGLGARTRLASAANLSEKKSVQEAPGMPKRVLRHSAATPMPRDDGAESEENPQRTAFSFQQHHALQNPIKEEIRDQYRYELRSYLREAY